MKPVQPLLLTLLLMSGFVTNLGAQTAPVSDPIPLDRNNLEEIEDLSESLANSLLEFSAAVRQQNLEVIPLHFADTIRATPFMKELPSLDQQVKWISYGNSTPKSKARLWQSSQFMNEWEQLLRRYRQLDDARFKVKEAEFTRRNGALYGSGAFKFFLVGHSPENRPLWMKGNGKLQAFQDPDSFVWKIEELLFSDIQVLESDRELFSEVSEPARVALSLPPYGSPGNDGFVYHGAAAGDLNGNGLIDLVVTGNSQTFLYLNQGDGTFLERGWNLGLPPNSRLTAPLLLDFDNDGDSDLFIAAVGSQMLFENRLIPDGQLQFRDISAESGVSLPAHGFSAVAGDVNKDGLPDIYVNSYNAYGQIMPNSWHRATNGTANLLFINQGDGTYKESGAEWGVRDTRWSYAAEFVDINGDHRQDLYVANDFGENALYLNRGDHFEDVAERSGVLDPGNGMGVSFGDYNNDGVLDLYVTNMSSTAGNRILQRLIPNSEPDDHVLRKLAAGNSLFRGNPDGTFTDVTRQAGPFSAGWAWGGVFFDIDNDGWDDLYSTNGFVSGQSMKDT